MSKKSLIIIVVIILAIVALVKLSGTDDGDVSSVTPAGDEPAESMIIALNELNASGEAGSATLLGMGEKTKVVVALTGAPAGIPQPAHIHRGACPNPADVKYPLTTVVGGASETTLDVSMKDLLAQLPLAINVHKSGDDLATYVVCGDIIGGEGAMEKDGVMTEKTEGGVMEKEE